MTHLSSIQYKKSTVKRAERALYFCPFSIKLFSQMKRDSVPLAMIAQESGFNSGYTAKVLSERQVEIEINWLIQVGLLRREVDGQGITDSFRLTPLGRQILDDWEQHNQTKSLSFLKEWTLYAVSRWLNLSS